MERRRLSWCMIATLSVLLFVTAEALRGPSSQTEEQVPRAFGSRGTARFNAKSVDEYEASTEITATRSRSNRDRTSQPRRISNVQRNYETTTGRSSTDSRGKSEFGSRAIGNSRSQKATRKDAPSVTPVPQKVEIEELQRQSSTRRNEKSATEKYEENKSFANGRTNKDDNSFSRRASSSRGSAGKSTRDNLNANTGPSVFSATTEFSRSRTGRKIQVTHSSRDSLKKQVPAARRFDGSASLVEGTTIASRRSERKCDSTNARGAAGCGRRGSRDSVRGEERKSDSAILTASESVRVDIPLTVSATDLPAFTTLSPQDIGNSNNSPKSTSTRGTERRSDEREFSRSSGANKESRNASRPKSRGRSNSKDDTVSTASARSSRRGSFKFTDFASTDVPKVQSSGDTTNRTRNSKTNVRNSGKEPAKSRSRGRSSDIVSRSVVSGAQEQRGINRRSFNDRISDGKSKNSETRSRIGAESATQDQDVRTRTRGRGRSEITTRSLPDQEIATIALETTTWIPDSTISTSATSTETSSTQTAATARTSTTTTTEGSPRGGRRRNRGGNSASRNPVKEDFFNYGLGFRGRKFSTDASSSTTEKARKLTSSGDDSQTHGSPGWTLRRRPNNKWESSSTGQPASSTTTPTTTTTSTTTSTTTTAPTTGASTTTSAKDQINEIGSSDDRSKSKENSVGATTPRRGLKKPNADGRGGTTAASASKGSRRGNNIFDKGGAAQAKSGDLEESDNYPPNFKARLFQMKNSTAKISGGRNIGRNNSEGKKSAAALFAERSRMKLEIARKLVKPELNVEENVLDITTVTIAPAKAKSTEAPVAEETRKIATVTKATPIDRREEVPKITKSSLKASRTRKELEESSSKRSARVGPRKGRILSERTVTSISVEENTFNNVIEQVTTPYSSTAKKERSSVTSTNKEPSDGRSYNRRKQEDSVVTTTQVSVETTTFDTKMKSRNYQAQSATSARRFKASDDASKPDYSTGLNSKKVQSFQSSTTTSTPRRVYSSTVTSVDQETPRKWKTEATVKPRLTTNAAKGSIRPRYTKKLKENSLVQDNEVTLQETTPAMSTVTSRYTRKKVKIYKLPESTPKTSSKSVVSAEDNTISSKRREFRPRTATYRRHSELPTTLVETTTKVDQVGVAITPKVQRYHATVKTSTPISRSIPQEPQVRVSISNDTSQTVSGITDSSNGNSGNSNIFNPTRSAFLNGSDGILEQLRSTVAPLLSSLGNRTPIFAASYSNVNNGSSPRITPNGSPPRFSARYKGAELFLRKPSGYQPTVPSITSSSTTPSTPVESTGSAPPIDIQTPGEPNFVTYYQAVESANIRNEQTQLNALPRTQEENVDGVIQVDSNQTNGTTENANSNNVTTSPNVETASPQTPDTTTTTTTTTVTVTTIDITAMTRPDNISNRGLSEEAETTNPPISTEGSTSTTESMSTTTETSSVMSPEDSSVSPMDNEVTGDLTSSLAPTTESTTTVSAATEEATVTTESSSGITTVESTPTVVGRVAEDSNDSRVTDLPATTESAVSMDTTMPTTQRDAMITTVSEDTTVTPNTESTTATMSTESVESTQSSTESLESNTIPQTESSTESDNMLTTTTEMTTVQTTSSVVVTTTFRPRLIDLAQDILSRLQDAINNKTPAPFIVTPTVTTTLATPTEESTTVGSTTIDNTVTNEVTEERTSAEPVTTPISTSTFDSSISMGDAANETLTTTTQSNSVATSAAETTTQDVGLIMTTQVDSTTESNPAVNTQDSVIDQNATDTVENSTPASVDTEITTVVPTSQNSTVEGVISVTSNDTLLTELMTIAKSLLTEAINETEVPPVQNRILESFTTPESTSTTLQISSTDSAGTTPMPVITERAETTLSSTESSTEPVGETTLSISENEIESDPTSSTTVSTLGTTTDVSAPSITENGVASSQTSESIPVGLTLESLGQTTTTNPDENEVETTLTSFLSATFAPDLENTTQNPMTQMETTSATITTSELTTLTVNLRSDSLATTETQETSPNQSTEIPDTTMTSQVTELTTSPSSTVPNDEVVSTVTPQLDVSTDPTTIAAISEDQLAVITPVYTNNETTLSDQTEPVAPTTIATVTMTPNDSSNPPVTEPTTEVAGSTLVPTSQSSVITTMPQTTPDQSVESTSNPVIPEITSGMSLNATDASDSNQPTLTTTTSAELTTELIIDLTNATEVSTTNQPAETTVTPTESTSRSFIMDSTATVDVRFQDTTSTATAQGTAGSGNMQFDQTTITPTTITESLTTTSDSSSNSPFTDSPSSGTTSTSIDTTTTLTTTTMTPTPTTTVMTTIPTTTTVMTSTSTTVPQTSTTMETATSSMQPTTVADNVDINDNLITTETPSGVSTMATTMGTPDASSAISRMDIDQGTTDLSSVPMETTSVRTTSTSTVAPITSRVPGTPPRATWVPPTTPYMGRFGGSRLTPAPRFSPSSSTRAPLRDYHVYGIYPNKTIVRKRPEDNLIDARNVDSPYVIFGIYPDGRLVRKFPNGTIIPDPPRSPVEVVFSLRTTTTTNRPPPRFFYNQANQGTFNQFQAPNYYNNRRPVPELVTNNQNFGTLDLGLTGNAISGPNGGGADFTGPLGTPGSPATTGTMKDVFSTPNASPVYVRPTFSDQQGGRIVQQRERDEASRSKEAGGQRSSVYIGQDKFVNYWTSGTPSTDPRVVSVNINSVASALNEGPASSSTSVPSFENLLNSQPSGQVAGSPWRDPLDQIFGITTSSPVITASVASNTLDDSSESNQSMNTQSVNPFVEVFSPTSGMMNAASSTATAAVPSSTTTTTTSTTSTTTTTTPVPTTTTTTTTPVPTTTTTTTTTTPAPTTTTTTTTTPAPTTTTTTTTSTTTAPTTTTNSGAAVSTAGTTSTRTQNAFGTTFDDLAFLNALAPDSGTTTQKTLNEVEQLLANKILSLALGNPGSNRAPKAIQTEKLSLNSIGEPSSSSSSSAPIIIDLLPSSTSTIRSTVPTTSAKPSTSISTTKAPVVVTAKSIPSKPRTTTQAPVRGFGESILQALFGRSIFEPPKPVKSTAKPTKATPSVVQITQRPVVSSTPRNVDISQIRVVTPSNLKEVSSSTTSSTTTSTTPKPVSTTSQPLLNNPNPRLPNVVSSTYSPQDDANFLAALLNAVEKGDTKASASNNRAPELSSDDEAFLKAILSGQANIPLPTTTPNSAPSNAALLAALLKAQGIEPPTPANNLREQLQLASAGKNLGAVATSSTVKAASSTSTTPRPTTTTTRKSTTVKLRTTTWSPSSTYPPPLFSGFGNSGQSSSGDPKGGTTGGVRDQVVNVALGATRAFSQFLGAAISGAAQQLQSFVRNNTRIPSLNLG